MRRILFVDDEPQVLESLRDALRPWRREWSAELRARRRGRARRSSPRERFDVVVSDMRMPGMDGAALLRRVQRAAAARGADHALAAPPTATCWPAPRRRAPLPRQAVRHRRAGARRRRRPRRSATRTRATGLHHAASAATALPCAPALYAELAALLAGEYGRHERGRAADRARHRDHGARCCSSPTRRSSACRASITRIDEAISLPRPRRR